MYQCVLQSHIDRLLHLWSDTLSKKHIFDGRELIIRWLHICMRWPQIYVIGRASYMISGCRNAQGPDKKWPVFIGKTITI